MLERSDGGSLTAVSEGVQRLKSIFHRPWPVARLLTLFVVALALPLVPLVIWEGYRVADDEQQDLRKTFMVISEDLGDDVDELLQDYITTLHTLATLSDLSGGNLATTYEHARTILAPAGISAFLSDPSGRQLFNTNVPFGSPLPRSSGFDQMVVTTKRPHVSDFIMDAEEKRPVIIVSVPIMKDDDLIYVFSLSVDVGVFQHILDKKFQPKMTVVIADRGGTIIARSPRDNAFVGRSMPMREVSDYVDTTGRAQDLEGQPSLFARKISRIAGWSILSFVPESAANPKIIRGLRGYVAMMALVTTLGLVGAVYLGRIVVAPLHGLQRAAEALGKGKDFTFERCFLKEARAVEEALAQSAAQRKALEDQKSLLVNELSHRSRNQLSVIQSVARQTLARSPSTADAQLVLNQRLNSLARTYKTLTQTPSYNAPIGRIVSDELAAISSQSMIEGPELFLNPTAAQTLALIVHELATNAAKYGALSVAGGVVRVRWWTVACGNDMRFHFSWKESGGPTVKAPERRGFGSVLIVDIATMQLDGQVSREFRREGFRYHLGAPLVEIAARPALVQQVQNFL